MNGNIQYVSSFLFYYNITTEYMSMYVQCYNKNKLQTLLYLAKMLIMLASPFNTYILLVIRL